jgi:hypothetical protein
MLAFLFLVSQSIQLAAADQTLVDVNASLDVAGLESRDVEMRLLNDADDPVVQMTAGDQTNWPGVTFRPPTETWNLSSYDFIAVDVRNAGQHPVNVSLRVDSPAQDGKESRISARVELAPDERRAIRIGLRRKVPDHLQGKLFGMRGYPAQLDPGKGIDASKVVQILLFVTKQSHPQVIEFGNISAEGSYDGGVWFTADADPFPMINRFGQYMHTAWPGKTQSEQSLDEAAQREDEDLKANPGPQDWDRYGGWQGGPKLEATGHFRVQKYQDKWWLVDPDGRLFWSHGIDCVRASTAYTPVTDREFYFADLPAADSPLSEFYGTGNWAPHGYYQGKGRYKTFNFTGANLYRKYGSDWKAGYNELCHRRLRSWGLNTIGNWSDTEIYGLQKTAYVVTCGSGRKPIEGSTGYWGKFPDPFDPDFLRSTQRNMARYAQAANSPRCIGVFVDNELAWGKELSLALAALASPGGQASKKAFVGDLQAKYDDIGALNAVWGTDHESWDALLEAQIPPDEDKARDDLAAFASRVAEEYFRVCRQSVKETAPNTLYLGCRFAWVNDRAVRAAAQYCDVIGYNKYSYTIADFRLPDGVDMPAIVGEFHFGALDRGMFHTGLKPTVSQADRADKYRDYVRGALKNPNWVGTHWFQFGDQATTGRGDGENYQIGFLDVCDRPYPETIEASREIGAGMYRLR